MSFGRNKAGRVLLVATLLIACIGTVSASQSTGFYYDFDNGCPPQDEVNGISASCEESVSTTTNGAFNDALSFTGTDWVDLPENSNTDINSGDFTYNIWFKTSSTDDQVLTWMYQRGSGNKQLWTRIEPSSNQIRLLMEDGDDTNSKVTTSQTYNDGDWHMVTFTRDSGNELAIWIDGDKKATSTDSEGDITPDNHNGVHIGEDIDDTKDSGIDGDLDEPRLFLRELSQSEIESLYNTGGLNTAPSIDSVSTSPSSWTLGSSVNVSADVSDSDGTVSGVSADVWENGSQIVSDASLTQNSGTWEVDNLFSVDESDVYYNLSLTATDDDGATATYSDSQLIKDTAPNINIENPANKTYFTYKTPVEVNLTDNDNVPGEQFQCDAFIRSGLAFTGNAYQYSKSFTIKEGVNKTFTDTGFTRLSRNTAETRFKVSCSDPGSNSASKSKSYTVKSFEVKDLYSGSPVYETVNQSFEPDLKVGSMVNNVDFDLNYSGTIQDTDSLSSNSVQTLEPSLYHEIPLVENNQTTKNWSVKFDVNKTDFQTVSPSSSNVVSGSSDSTSIINDSTSTKNQEIEWSYSLQNQTLSKQNYAGGSEIVYNAYIKNYSGKGSVSGRVKNSQKNNFYDLKKSRESDKIEKYFRDLPTDYIDSSSVSVDVVPDYTVSFNGETRDFKEGNLSATLEKLEFGSCGNVNGETALSFTTYNEKDRETKLDSILVFAAEYWNPESPDVKKVANFSSSGSKKHDLCISPGYAEAKVDSTEKLIQYTDPEDDYVLRSYFLINETVDNSTTDVPLYMLAKNQSSRVRFTVQNENREKLSDVVIRIKRYFPSVDKELTTAMVKTGSQGETETFLEVNEIYYAFDLYDDKDLIKAVPQQVIPSDLALTFTVGGEDVPDWYDYDDAVSGDCGFNATQVTCDYTSSTEAMNNVTLSVEKDEMIGETVYGTSSGETSSGSLTVKGFNASKNKYNYNLVAYFGNGNSDLIESGSLGEQGKPVGDTGVMISMFLFLTMSFAGLWKPSASIALGTFSIIISAFLPFLALSQTALTALIALGAVLVWRMN